MNIQDTLEAPTLKGEIKTILRDAEGNVVQETTTPNNILVSIRKPIISLLGGYGMGNADLPFIKYISFGSDDTPANINQTGLVAPIAGAIKLIAANPIISADGLTATFAVLFGMDELNNTTMKEACLVTADGTAVARSVIGSHSKPAGFYFEFYWTIGYQA